MLFDTLRRKNQAEQEEREWNANRPEDYVSRNKDAMDSLTGQIGSGFDWDTGSKAYQQYRAQAQANAAASAENAQANAAMLAGGYGSSYADSVAKQGQQQALSGIDNAVPSLRGQALSEYQNQQNDLLSALSGMANTEALDRSAYGSNFANYTAWQNFLANQSEQARNENDNYWNNLWNTVKNIGSAALTAYDGYKGYTQQQWENQMAEKQYNNSYEKSLLDSAYDYYRKGETQVADQLLSKMGMNTDIFSQMGSSEYTVTEQIKALQQAISMANDGQTAAAKWIAQAYGLPEGLINYGLYSQTGSGSSSGGSRGYYSQSSEWSKSELRNLMKDRESVAAKGGDTTWYDGILADAGYPVPETKSTESTGKSGETSAGGKLALSMSNKWALPGGTTGGSTGKSAGMPYSNALSYAKGWKEQGMDANTIASRLMNLGASDDVIDRAMQNAGF